MQSIKDFLKKHYIILILIFLASFVYFYKIENVPNGFYIDEALPAYNTYSILKTGKDEYGKTFPIVFRFYGSYNPSLYTYATVLPISVFGLNIFSARFISVISGLAFSVVVYLLFLSSDFPDRKRLAVFGALVALISPWIIFYSRIGYEVVLGLTLFSLGAYFLWKSLSKSINFVWAALFLSLSTYAAYTERFIVPFTLIGFVIIFRKIVLAKPRVLNFFRGIGVAILTQIPNFYILITPAFFPKTNLLAASALVSQSLKLDMFLPHIISVGLAWLREFLSQYFGYLSPKSLFFLPDPDPQRSIPALSVFYAWMVIPYFLGIYSLWKDRASNFTKFLVLILLISPIPAALTRDPFATHRALPLAFPIIIILAIGINGIRKMLKPRSFNTIGILILLVSAVFFWRSYFVFLPNERAQVWGYGFDKLAEEILIRPNTHFVIDQARIKPAYINLAFFLKYPPKILQDSVDPSIKNHYYGGTPFNDHYNFGQIETKNIDWKTDPLISQILVGDQYSISEDQAKEHHLVKIFEIRDPLNQIVFVGYQTNP